jgi:hypothetical protein
MNLPLDIREFGKFDVKQIKRFLKKNKIDWNSSFNKMNNRDPYFSQTNSFPIVEEYEIWDHKFYEIFYPLLRDIISTCQYHFGPGRIYKCNLSSIPSGSRIYPHKDTGLSFVFSHRMHLPIVTNKNVFFEIERQMHNLKEGNLYEINNQKFHGVRNINVRKFDRIHLILDWMGEEYYEFI